MLSMRDGTSGKDEVEGSGWPGGPRVGEDSSRVATRRRGTRAAPIKASPGSRIGPGASCGSPPASEVSHTGSTVDEEGCLWNAQLISGDLVRYAPDGRIERRIGLPVRNITSVMFGGDKLDEIFVTSMARVKHPAVHDLFAKEIKPQFLAGSLFRITGLGIRGVPEPRFAG